MIAAKPESKADSTGSKRTPLLHKSPSTPSQNVKRESGRERWAKREREKQRAERGESVSRRVKTRRGGGAERK